MKKQFKIYPIIIFTIFLFAYAVLGFPTVSVDIPTYGYVEPSPTPIATPTPTPTATPEPTPTPTPTPAPTPLGDNLAVIPEDWQTSVFSNVFVDDSIVHTAGQSSIRLEPKGSSGNTARECWTYGLKTVQPGDHVVFKCWIKTEALPSGVTIQYGGARIGIDLRNDGGGHQYCLDTLEDYTYPDSNVNAFYVPFGSDWTLRTIDFIVPSTSYTYDIYTGTTIASSTINSVSPWIQVWSNLYGDEPANAWFADAELYINP